MNKLIPVVLLVLLTSHSFCQLSTKNNYPQIKGYASIVHPIVTFDKDKTSFNFDGSYTVGFPFGINILKSDRIGFSFELTPIIKVDSVTDKMSSLLFHPGVIFRFPHNFTFTQRLAFETNGRYGLTMVFNKVVIVRPNAKYFIASPIPIRFGNDKPASLGIGIQLGVVF
ncbi:hypothetical protein [Ferruginibacter sp.]